MSEQLYDKEELTRYLLGTLPADETERLDELSFTDEDFNAALRETENDLTDAYARGELTGERADEFKARYFGSPHRRAKVDFAIAFKKFAENKSAAHADTAREIIEIVPAKIRKKNDAASDERKSFWRSMFGAFAFPRSTFGWVAACVAALLFIIGGWLVFENLRLRRQMNDAQTARAALQQRERELQTQIDPARAKDSETEQELARAREQSARIEQQMSEPNNAAQPNKSASQIARLSPAKPHELHVVTFDLIPQTRGASSLAALKLPAKAESVTMRLRLETNEFSAYRVALRDQSTNRIIWRSASLKAAAKGDSKILNVNLPARLLQNRIYALEVSGASASGADEFISSYPFRIVRE
jgi:hypothetical protein